MALFLLVAFGLAWLFALPLWITGANLDSPLVAICGVAMMSTPSLGVVAVRWRERRLRRRAGSPSAEPPARTADPPTWRRLTGVSLGYRPGRTVIVCAAVWLGVPLLVTASVAVSAALGLLSLDLAHFSLFRQTLATATGGRVLPADLRALVALQLVSGVLISPAINGLFALGEEWGWRGWLLPRLVGRFGLWNGLVVSGVVWGLWHAPLTLRGYNYPQLGAWAAPVFVGFCILFGALIGWLRLVTGSVWPAVIGHASLNGTAGIVALVGDAARPPNTALVGVTGVVGWAVLAVVLAAVARWLPWAPPSGPPPVPDQPDRDQKWDQGAGDDAGSSGPTTENSWTSVDRSNDGT